jgi:hypothetical protein
MRFRLNRMVSVFTEPPQSALACIGSQLRCRGWSTPSKNEPYPNIRKRWILRGIPGHRHCQSRPGQGNNVADMVISEALPCGVRIVGRVARGVLVADIGPVQWRVLRVASWILGTT